MATSVDCGGAGSMGDSVEPTLIGMPLLRRRRVPRKKAFSLLDLAMWA